MRRQLAWPVVLLTASVASLAHGQEPDYYLLTGDVPTGPETHFFVPFDVPEGIVEIEVRHDNLSEDNVLDWGLDDPNGFRGWGGGNSENAIVGEQAASRSYIPGPMPAGRWEVVVGKARVDDPAGQYRIEIFLRTEATLEAQARSPYEDPGVLDEEARWYAGDFHVHTEQSGDSSATMEASLAYARDIGLDFVMFSEHNTNSGLTLYSSVQPDDILIIPGVEWTTYSGHANAIGATEWVDHKTGVRGVTVETAIEEYRQQGAFFYPTHPDEPDSVFCLGCEWGYDVDATTLDGVEVWSGIWEGTDFWNQVVEDGSHAVAIGGSDDHSAGQGNMVTGRPIGSPTTMVYAANLSVEAILEGLAAGRTVVKVEGPDGPMLETEITGTRVGDTVFADTATLSAIVTGGEGLSLLVIKNGRQTDRIPIDADPFTHEIEVTAPEVGEDRYRHQVNLGGGPRTIGSYVWLRGADESPDDGTEPSSSSGCSFRVSSRGDKETAVVFAVMAALVYWRRSRSRRT